MRHNQSGDSEELSMRLLSSFFRFHHTPWHFVPAPGLSRSETGILLSIDRSAKHGEALRIADLSRMLRVSSPTVTQHINNLEGQDFVARTQSREDKRAVNLALTEKGAAALEQHRAAMEKNIEELCELLGEESSEMLISLLGKVSDYFIEKQKSYSENNL